MRVSNMEIDDPGTLFRLSGAPELLLERLVAMKIVSPVSYKYRAAD
jgi:hypothetical protein